MQVRNSRPLCRSAMQVSHGVMSRAVAEVAEVPVVGSKIPSARNITGEHRALSGQWLLVLANLKLAVELMFISGGVYDAWRFEMAG
ncbi:hypothetical protein D3C78_1608970 [compost metagenome]